VYLLMPKRIGSRMQVQYNVASSAARGICKNIYVHVYIKCDDQIYSDRMQ